MPENKPSKKPIIDMPSKKQLAKVVGPYSDKELELTPEMEEKMKKDMEFFDLYGIDYSKFKPEFLSFITDKKAYPNYDQYQYIAGQHDLKKWMYALKNIHYKQKAGFPYREAIKTATQGWNKMEIYDFLNWLRFYGEGTHMKYKFAQVWYTNDQPGYFLHIKPDPPKEPEPRYDANAVNDAREEAERKEEKRQIIEKQRAKIIGRLDSAEKLLRSQDGQEFAGKELENLMEAIYALKKKVQLVNKLSISTRLYEDMIVREGNVLKRNGFTKAAEILYSLAQTPGASAEVAQEQSAGDAVPPPVPPPPPTDPSGAPGGLPATLPTTPSVQTEKPTSKAINEFISNMNEGNKTDATNSEDDQLEVEDSEEPLMVTEAQITPAPPPPPAVLEDIPTTDTPAPDRNPPAFIPEATPKAKKPLKEEPLEVTEEDLPPPGGEGPSTEGKPLGGVSLDKIDNVFKDVSMEEIVAELEDISTYYKVREMPRRLARLDMMFDAKGISVYFPSLSEAQNRALDANNYIATRIDDILAKVRGAMVTNDIASKLKTDQDKEKQRKQMRKEQENAELEGGPTPPEGKETPNVELGELGTPATPLPAAPARPSAV
jgi:hypothetical protein